MNTPRPVAKQVGASGQISLGKEFAGRTVLIDGISRFRLRDGRIAEYFESVNGCVAMAQLGVEPPRMAKVAGKWAQRLLAEPRSVAFLARAKGVRPAG